jgi:hypothetical protein
VIFGSDRGCPDATGAGERERSVWPHDGGQLGVRGRGQDDDLGGIEHTELFGLFA